MAFWDWGWGIYASNYTTLTTATRAKYAWSVITIGNDPMNSAHATELQAVLTANPGHKFFIATWPIFSLGPSDTGADFWDYKYRSGTRTGVLANIQTQIDWVVTAVGASAVIGASFLEELPFHWTSGNDLFSWDGTDGDRPASVVTYNSEIDTDSGLDFDWTVLASRDWWKTDFLSVLSELYVEMDTHLPAGAKVAHWPQANFNHQDQLNADAATYGSGVLPYATTDTPSEAQVTFAYPINWKAWHRQALRPYPLTSRPYFSQLGLNTGGITNWRESMRFVQKQHVGNLGSMVFAPHNTAGATAIPWYDGTSRTADYHAAQMADNWIWRPV
jgi:hypothetical protein